MYCTSQYCRKAVSLMLVPWSHGDKEAAGYPLCPKLRAHGGVLPQGIAAPR